MSDVQIPPELVAEALTDKWVGRRLSVSDEFPPIPIKHEDKVVGFQLPGRSKRTGDIYTGSIYVGKDHRKRGLGTQALRSFLEAHPEAISYVHKNNEASQKAHAKAGWSDTKRQMMGNRKATVWKKSAGISYDEILRGLSGESPQRAIPSEEIAELAKAYRDAEAEQTKLHIPVGAGVGGLLGGGLGAALGHPQNMLGGGLAGLGIGGVLGGIVGHSRRKRLLEMRENLGRELGTIAQRGLPSESAYGGLTMKKTASQIADEVLEKTAFGAIGRGLAGAGKLLARAGGAQGAAGAAQKGLAMKGFPGMMAGKGQGMSQMMQRMNSGQLGGRQLQGLGARAMAKPPGGAQGMLGMNPGVKM